MKGQEQLPTQWVGKGGAATPISEMTDEYLANAFRNLERRYLRKHREIEMLVNSLEIDEQLFRAIIEEAQQRDIQFSSLLNEKPETFVSSELFRLYCELFQEGYHTPVDDLISEAESTIKAESAA